MDPAVFLVALLSTVGIAALTVVKVARAYWVAIESFDENGVAALSAAVPIR